jgi:hypothetical protein
MFEMTGWWFDVRGKKNIKNESHYLAGFPCNVLPLPFFLLGWCSNHNPSLRRTFHSIRRSGGIYSIVFYCFLKALMVSAINAPSLF